ncbi:MAG: hypothetical protein M3O26_15665 [Pseudomonadota bacterium]|nr:hypothetical protein [Pseudomonadota bacterium]
MNATLDTSRQAARDEQLEREIDAAYERMLAASAETESREHFLEMARLIYRRSPQQVQKMEVERRLEIKRAKFSPREGRGTNP